jgi:hypothetical protein
MRGTNISSYQSIEHSLMHLGSFVANLTAAGGWLMRLVSFLIVPASLTWTWDDMVYIMLFSLDYI